MLDGAIGSIENDGLIAALRENAILYDRSSLQRLPPSSDVTPQLHLLLASKEFQREIKRYQELLDIRQSLRYWGNSFPGAGADARGAPASASSRNCRNCKHRPASTVSKICSCARRIRRAGAGHRSQREDYEALANAGAADNLERI